MKKKVDLTLLKKAGTLMKTHYRKCNSQDFAAFVADFGHNALRLLLLEVRRFFLLL